MSRPTTAKPLHRRDDQVRPSRNRGCELGSYQWVRATNGLLAPRELVRLMLQGAAYVLWPQIHHATVNVDGRQGGLRSIDLDEVAPPETRATREADELCAAVPAVLNHSLRCYWFSALLAATDGVDLDRELTYVAALVHDIGFADPQRGSDGRPCCLTLVGAEAALSIAAHNGWSSERAYAAAEAIALHANVYVSRRHGPEAYYLYAGARLDQTGFRYASLAPSTIDNVLLRAPRERWKDACIQMMLRQPPRTRVNVYAKWMAGNILVRRAPFAE